MVVVGSGAGGGMMAAQLAKAGKMLRCSLLCAVVFGCFDNYCCTDSSVVVYIFPSDCVH